MLKNVKKVYYVSKGAVNSGVKGVSNLTLGTASRVALASVDVLDKFSDILNNTDNKLAGWAERKKEQANNVVSRDMFWGISVVSEVTFASVMIVLGKGSLFLLNYCVSPLLKMNNKIIKSAGEKIEKCKERVEELRRDEAIFRADGRNRSVGVCFN